MNNMVFLAPSTMQMCEIPIGDPVIIEGRGNSIVRTAWPTNDKTLLSVSMTRKGIESSRINGLVKISKLLSDPSIAREITISYTGKSSLPKVTPELEFLVKNHNERSIITVGNHVSVPYYGKKLSFKIVAVKSDQKDDNSPENSISEGLEKMKISDKETVKKFYTALYSTKWKILLATEQKEEAYLSKGYLTIEDLGGYETLINDLRDVIDVALGKWKRIKGFNVPRGILVYGTAGVGKSVITNAVMAEYDEVKILSIKSWEIQSKIAGETEARLNEIFQNSRIAAPCIIFIEDVDILCPRKGNTNQDNDKKIYATLVKLIDDLRSSGANVVVLATTSRPDLIDGTLRRAGRLDKEFEVCAPTPLMRKDILIKILNKISHSLSDEEIERIAFTTHGFVASDLHGLCSEAAMHAMKRYRSYEKFESDSETEIVMNFEDLNTAMKIAKPSAMKEVIVEVPNVKWEEIGGQKGLKLKLKQAVEWPLRHPEAFARLGITPPRGLLMFGPPGCSKTMIAKALATESKLNFLNIKGPELFSKWVGESERAVREVFRKARQVAPSIIFIDEIDALGGERGSSSSSGGSNVQERVLAQLLTELDGVTALGNVTLVAATNRPDRIDKALLRPGRLDRIVYVPLPDAETRTEIFSIKFSKMPIADDVNIVDLVDLSEGYSGAEVQAICHEAAMKALEESLDATTITKEHFKAAFSIVTPRTPASLVKLYEDYLNNYK
ncbi:ATPase family protein 2 homolog isoform X2 [Venturia canescens]|nr:ATPase family protein 2 homolog isoform X2 [Venturia canescens]